MRTYKLFNIWTYRRREPKGRPVLRLLYGVAVLNVYPLILLRAIWELVPDKTNATLPCAGTASLSAFSICFLLPAFLQLKLGSILYPDRYIDERDTDERDKPTSTPRNEEIYTWKVEALDGGIKAGDPAYVFFA